MFDLRGFGDHELMNVSVLAGHFSWGVWSELPSLRHSSSSSLSSVTPPCFVMGRHPVDRVVSYYYQRCHRESECRHYGVRFNNLTHDELITFISTFRQGLLRKSTGEIVIVDEGVEDACCRSLSNRKWTSGRLLSDVSLPDLLMRQEEEFALRNVGECVVGLQEDWENTKRVLRHWFPWMDVVVSRTGVSGVVEDEGEKRMKVTDDRESLDMIREDLRSVVEEMNGCDMRLYEKMKTQFADQLLVIESQAYL